MVAAALGRARDFARSHHIAVLAAETDRASALRVDGADDLLVDRAGEHHLDDFHRRLVGNPQAAGKTRILCRASSAWRRFAARRREPPPD